MASGIATRSKDASRLEAIACRLEASSDRDDLVGGAVLGSLGGRQSGWVLCRLWPQQFGMFDVAGHEPDTFPVGFWVWVSCHVVLKGCCIAAGAQGTPLVGWGLIATDCLCLSDMLWWNLQQHIRAKIPDRS